MAPELGPRNWIKSVGELAGAAAGLAALVYITGGLALQLRLGSGGVPSSVAVPQLPREFLISLGLLIVAPAIAAGMLASLALGRLSNSDQCARIAERLSEPTRYTIAALGEIEVMTFPQVDLTSPELWPDLEPGKPPSRRLPGKSSSRRLISLARCQALIRRSKSRICMRSCWS